MQRYRTYQPLDDLPITDGDASFKGFYSRYQPTSLTDGQLWFSQNMRMDRGTAKVRAGIKSLSNDITLVNQTLIVGSFSLANSVAVSSITRAGATATVTTSVAHGYSSTNRVNIRGANQSEYNGDFTITVTGATTFTYAVSGTPASPATGTILANKGPRVFNSYNSKALGSGDVAFSDNTEGIVVASSGAAYLYRYGQSTLTINYPANETCDVGSPCVIIQYLNQVYLFRGYQTASALSVSSITRAATTATVTTATAHGRTTNDWVTISGASPDGYNGIVQITVTGTTTFTYTCGGALATPATGTITARPCKPPLVWDMSTTSPTFSVVTAGPHPTGAPLIRMPAADWAMFFKSRMVVPYSRDQLLLSDILDANTYDPSQTQFRILPGTADWIVGAFPYQQARLLVLYRKSVHTVFLDGASLSIASSYEITRNFGCVSRRTIANCGDYIVWLSDIGVVRMDINSELSLTTNTAPLSEPIADIISTINWAYADSAVATYWNNRYYLAVPTGSKTTNNTILVYNFLNDAWESVDTYPSGFDVINFHVISYNGTKRIHAVSSVGYVTLTEENQTDEFGAPGSVMNYTISGMIKTRNYIAGTFDMKRVKRTQIETNITSGESMTVAYQAINPDSNITIANYVSTDSGSNATLKYNIGRRNTSGRIEITTTGGRPEITSISIEASQTGRQTLSYT